MKRKIMNIGVWVIIFALVIMSFVWIPGHTDAKINEDYTVANSSVEEYYPDIAVTTNGIIYVAYYYDAPVGQTDSIIVKKSSNYGATFDEVGNFLLSIDNCAEPPRIAIDGDNNLYLVYGEFVGEYTYLNLKKYGNNGEWTTLIDGYPIGLAIQSNPDIAAIKYGATNYIVVTYVNYTETPEPHYDMVTQISTDGVNFVEKIFRSGINYVTDYYMLRTALTYTGVSPYLAVGYVGYNGAGEPISCVNVSYYDNIVNGGWATICDSSFGTTDGEIVDVAFGENGMVYAAVEGKNTERYTLCVRSGTNYGTNWNDEIIVYESVNGVWNFDINASANNVYVVYSTKNGEYLDIMYNYSTDCGADFETGALVNRDYVIERNQDHPAICSLGDNIYVAWEDYPTSSNADIKMRKIAGPNTPTAYHRVKVTNMADMNGNPYPLPDFVVKDMVFSEPYLVMVGEHNVLAMNVDTNRVLLDYTVSNNDYLNSVTMNGTFVIIVGKDTSNSKSAIWTADLGSTPASISKVSSTPGNWHDDYIEFTKVHYEPNEGSFVISGYDDSNKYAIAVAYSTNPSAWNKAQTTVLYSINAICNVENKSIIPLSNCIIREGINGGGSSGDWFGSTVASAGDVNGDGFDDVIISAVSYSSKKGKVCVYYGNENGIPSDPSWERVGRGNSDYFGVSVATAGDVNNDGYDDIIIGAYGGEIGYTYSGRVEVYYGSEDGLPASPSWTKTGGCIAYQYYGSSVSSAGDVNNDGCDDIIIGAYGYAGSNGRVEVYYGSEEGLLSESVQTFYGSGGEAFGFSVSSAGDVNGDGYDDIIIGAPYYSSYTGKVYVYHGGIGGLPNEPTQTVYGSEGEGFGWSVSGAGNVNGDEFDDVIISAYLYSSYTGKVYVFKGSNDGLVVENAWTKEGSNTNEKFGGSVAGISDVNKDGYDDIIIGANGYLSNLGKVEVYYGNENGLPNDGPSLTKVGSSVGENFGESVSSAGDVNGDGYNDIIVGAYAYSDMKGKAEIYLTSIEEISEYLLIGWSGSSNYYYLCDGEVESGNPHAPGNTAYGIPTISVKINDAVGVPAMMDSKQWIYLAAGSHVYRMSTDAAYQNPSVSEIDIDGDADSTSFTYYGIDYYYNESEKDKVVVVGGLDVNGGGGDDYGVVAVLSNAENLDVSKVYTEDFRINEEHTGGYYAVAIRNGDSFYIGGSYEILNSDYYGYETLELDVENVPPVASNFKVDYASVPYGSARTHAQLQPTGANPIAIWIDVTDPNSVNEITEVTLQAWHDGETGNRISWPDDPTDANGVVNITYNVTSNEFRLNYPKTGEVTLGLGSATPLADGTTLRIKFVFIPGKQARYGLDGGGTAGDDDCTWNVRFECNDTTNNLTEHGDWEFGYTKVTSLGGVVTAQVANPIAPGAGLGNYGNTNTLTITWSSNWKYKVSVEMTSSLYHAGPPTDTIPNDNVLVAEASSFTSGYSPNPFTTSNNDQQIDDYYAFNHGNPVYWYGPGGSYSTTAPPTGNEQTFQTHFRVYVQYGTVAGSYTANLQYVVDIA